MTGQRLLHYEITDKLGEGGMGVVYKARDTHLDRFVAVKVLPADKVTDPTRKARFVQEAKAASALNHPNIITVYDISADAGTDFIAMEYVDGKTLDQIIPRDGMRLGEALKIAIQIADALARAHFAGIVHRDLKPANIMVDGHGHVKVLDFGLAKLTEVSTDDRTVTMKTEEGAIMGTAAYMSPEQAEGRPVDARSDIFSFGALLYETVSGHRAFLGDSKLSTLSAVLQKEPEPLSAEIPHDLQKVILRCLRKDPARRFQHCGDVQIALEELKEESSAGSTARTVRPGVSAAWKRLLTIALAAIVAGGGWQLWRQSGSNFAPPRLVQLTSYPGSETTPTFSPDGNQVAFTWGGTRSDNADIYVKLVDQENALRLTTDPLPDGFPAWAPDGRKIAFLRFPRGRHSVIFLVSPLGGAELKLAELPTVGQLSWSADGKWLAVGTRQKGIYLVPAEGGEPRPFRKDQPPSNDAYPAFSPDGRQLAYVSCKSAEYYSCNVYVQHLDPSCTPMGEPRRITAQEMSVRGLSWSSNSESVVFAGGQAAAIILQLWRANAGAATKVEQLAWAGNFTNFPSISRAGDRLAFSKGTRNWDIWRLRIGEAPAPLITSSLDDTNPEFSPDGGRVAFSSLRSGVGSEVWVSDPDGSNQRQLTNRLGRHQGTPRWSPDGRWIAFDSQGASGQWDIWVIEASGGQPRRITAEPSDENMPSWSRDGENVYFRSDKSGKWEIWRASVADGKLEQVTRNGGFVAYESVDGKTLYYTKAEASPLFARSLDGGTEKQLVDHVSFRAFAVSEDGIYYIGRGDGNGQFPLCVLRFSTSGIQEIAKLDRPSNYGLALSPDRRTFLFAKDGGHGTDLILAEGFQ